MMEYATINPFWDKPPDLDKETERLRVLEANYDAAGVTVESIKPRLQEVLRKVQKDKEFPILFNEESFYLQSSDPIALLNEMDFSGQKVMTVAASGDFAQIFLNRGAAEVRMFDFSPFAAFWTELKIAAASNLTFEEYGKFFGEGHSLKADSDNYDKDTGEYVPIKLFDARLILKVRQGLSVQARRVFDLLETEDFEELFITRNKFTNDLGFARSRDTEFVGDVIKEKTEYEALQANLKKGEWSIKVEEAKTAAHETGNMDVVYISNIGYEAEQTVDMAKEFRKQGAKRVIFSLQHTQLYNRSGLDRRSYDATGRELNFNYNDDKRLRDENKSQEWLVHRKTGAIFKPGDCFDVASTPVRLIGIRGHNGYDVLAELAFTAEH